LSFIVGICFTQGAATRVAFTVDDALARGLKKYWGTVALSMYSLFMATTGGEDWIDMAGILHDVHPLYCAVFMLYISFHTCVIANTITSLFVDSSLSQSGKDVKATVLNELEKKDDYIKLLREWFMELDADGSGQITHEEFVAHCEDAKMTWFCVQLDIDIFDVSQMFELCSDGGKQHVDLETFVVACIRLKGAAKSSDLVELLHRVTRKFTEFDHQFAAMKTRQRRMCVALDTLCAPNPFTSLPAHLPILS
jgi:Ca2+-binding EF-hand superfamily protein